MRGRAGWLLLLVMVLLVQSRGAAADAGDPLAPWVWCLLAASGSLAGVGLLLFSGWNRALKLEVREQTGQLSGQVADLQYTQRQLAESEERFRRLAEMSSDWFWEQDAEFCYTRFYGGMERLGIDFERYIGRHRWDFPVAGVTDAVWQEHREQLARHEPFRNFTYQIIGRDGHRTWVATSGQPVFDPAGRFAGYRGTARDITAQMRAQEDLAESYGRVRALLDGTCSFVGLLAPDGTLLEVNRAALDFAGVSRSQVLGRPFWETPWWSDANSRDRLRAAVVDARAGRFVRYETIHPDRNGAMHWVDFSLSAVRDGRGEVIYLVPEGRDITDAKRAREALDALVSSTGGLFGEAFQRALVEQLARLLHVRHVFVGELLPGGRRVRTLALWADDRVVDNMDYDLNDTPCDQVIGFECCVYPRDVAAIFPKDTLLREMGIEGYMGVPILAADREPIGILVVLHDQPLVDTESARHLMEIFSARAGMEMVRQRHEQATLTLNADLERRVAERTAQLATANRELEAFSSSVSHDLRAPLRHIGGFVDLLGGELGEGLSPDAARYLQIIRESAIRMDVLIDDLLAFSRIGRTELHRSAVLLDKLVEEVLQDLAGEAAGRDVLWKIAPLPPVQADRAMLRQVLANLLGNALKYSRPRARAVIEVGCLPEERGGGQTFFVRDNGVGFNMKYVDRLFGVFQRLHGSNEFEGTGIGLANVRRIVERHGGSVWAESAPDTGATFYFTLPSGVGAAVPAAVASVAA